MDEPARVVSKTRLVVGNLQRFPGMSQCFQFAAKNVHLRLWKVRQAARVIEVQVRQNNMAHIPGLKSQLAELVDGRLFGIIGNPQYILEIPHHARGMFVIVASNSCIYQRQPLVGLRHQYQRPGFETRPVGAYGHAV
jgi:hypothetical protein